MERVIKVLLLIHILDIELFYKLGRLIIVLSSQENVVSSMIKGDRANFFFPRI